MTPRYPIYIPSKGRYDRKITTRFLAVDKIPFMLVVEPKEYNKYKSAYPKIDFPYVTITALPKDGPFEEGVSYARNWIKNHAIAAGHKRHWQIDDNIRTFFFQYAEMKRIPANSGLCLRFIEDFTERYKNIGISGAQYRTFAPGSKKTPALTVNTKVYSCSLILNSFPGEFRGPINEDTDMCLQILASGYNTLSFNKILIDKIGTMRTPGGHTDEVYKGDGRLVMAKTLERRWPGVVETKRRFNRPQHVVNWKRFKRCLEKDPLSQYNSEDYQMMITRTMTPKNKKTLEYFEKYSNVS